MTDQQFTLLIIVLMLGFGGAFAGGFAITLEGVMLGVMIGLAIFAVVVVVGTIDWIAGSSSRERERAAMYRGWLSQIKDELRRAQRSGWASEIQNLTERLAEREAEVGPKLQLIETKLFRKEYRAARKWCKKAEWLGDQELIREAKRELLAASNNLKAACEWRPGDAIKELDSRFSVIMRELQEEAAGNPVTNGGIQ